MNKYQFCIRYSKLTKAQVTAMRRIAAENDAEFCYTKDPRGGIHYWFECENRGAPFDGDTARAVALAVKAAGIG